MNGILTKCQWHIRGLSRIGPIGSIGFDVQQKLELL